MMNGLYGYDGFSFAVFALQVLAKSIDRDSGAECEKYIELAVGFSDVYGCVW
jgi:hypothetical protein